MTANDEYSKQKAKDEGFTGFVGKPIQMSRLLRFFPENLVKRSLLITLMVRRKYYLTIILTESL